MDSSNQDHPISATIEGYLVTQSEKTVRTPCILVVESPPGLYFDFQTNESKYFRFKLRSFGFNFDDASQLHVKLHILDKKNSSKTIGIDFDRQKSKDESEVELSFQIEKSIFKGCASGVVLCLVLFSVTINSGVTLATQVPLAKVKHITNQARSADEFKLFLSEVQSNAISFVFVYSI